MRLIDADVLAETLGITDMSCERCAWYDRTKSLCGRGGDFEDACAAIEDAPTVEKRETGAWKDCGTYADLLAGRVHQCSICGAKFSMANERYTYCPNCGSEMEGTHET